MRCKHCQNWEICHHSATEDGSDLAELHPEELVRIAQREGCGAIAWTYNEPSIWFEYILDTAKLAKEHGLLTVMVTAGMINPPALRTLLLLRFSHILISRSRATARRQRGWGALPCEVVAPVRL